MSSALHASTKYNTDMTQTQNRDASAGKGITCGLVAKKSAVAAEWSKCLQGPPSYSMRKKKSDTSHLSSSSSSLSSSSSSSRAHATHTHAAAAFSCSSSFSSSSTSTSSLLRRRAEENENLAFALEDMRSLHRQVVMFREWEVEDDIWREREREQRLRDLEDEGKELSS